MRAMTLRAAAIAILLLAAQAGLARAQGPAPAIGAEVKDQKGASVGKIERIIAGPDGRPRQVLVRVDRVLRALPVEALQPPSQGAPSGAYVAVLTRAEIAALPPAD